MMVMMMMTMMILMVILMVMVMMMMVMVMVMVTVTVMVMVMVMMMVMVMVMVTVTVMVMVMVMVIILDLPARRKIQANGRNDISRFRTFLLALKRTVREKKLETIFRQPRMRNLHDPRIRPSAASRRAVSRRAAGQMRELPERWGPMRSGGVGENEADVVGADMLTWRMTDDRGGTG